MTAEDSRASSGPTGRLLRQIGLQVLLAIAVLALCEIVLRLIDLRYLRDGHAPGYSIAYHHDAELGWSPIPQSSSVFVGLRTIQIAHNSLGLRDIEPTRKGKNTILVLGDSIVWGYDAEAGERFTDRLREMLPADDIVNAGVMGYGTDQELLLLRRLWDRIRPDVVVLIFSVDTDRRDNSVNTRYDGYFKPYYEMRPDGEGSFKGQPVPRPRQTYFVENVVARNSWVARALVSAALVLLHPRIEVPDPTERLITMLRAEVEGRGAKFVVGLQRREPRIEALLDGVPTTSFDDAPHYSGEGDHWTPEGHLLVASRLKGLLSGIGIR